MCIEQCQSAPHRRRFLALSAANIAVASFWSRRATCAVPATNITVDEALARLKSGNEKFVAAPQLCALDLREGANGRAMRGRANAERQLDC